MLSNTKAQSSLEPKWALYSFLVCLLFVDQFTESVFIICSSEALRRPYVSELCFLLRYPLGEEREEITGFDQLPCEMSPFNGEEIRFTDGE